MIGVPNSFGGNAWGLLTEVTDEWKQQHGGVVDNLVQESCAGIR